VIYFVLFALGPIYWPFVKHWSGWHQFLPVGTVVITDQRYHWYEWQSLAGNSYLLAAVMFMAAVGYYLVVSRQDYCVRDRSHQNVVAIGVPSADDGDY
jgi:hypothetical protein